MWAAYYAANGWAEGSSYGAGAADLTSHEPHFAMSQGCGSGGSGAAQSMAVGGLLGLTSGATDAVGGEEITEAAGEAALPHGWREARDSTGRPYYFHALTGETQWDRPTAASTPADPAAVLAKTPSKVWKEAVAADGRTYFYQPATGATQWSRPESMDQPQLDEKAEADGQPEADGKPEADGQPEVDVQPEVDGQPEVEGKPEVDELPEMDAQPELNGQPEVGEQHEVDGQPEVNNMTMTCVSSSVAEGEHVQGDDPGRKNGASAMDTSSTETHLVADNAGDNFEGAK